MGIRSNSIQTKSLHLENISNNCWTNIVITFKIRLSV